MALRNIVTKEDKILYKVCRPVVKFNERLHQLLDDMYLGVYKLNYKLSGRRTAPCCARFGDQC